VLLFHEKSATPGCPQSSTVQAGEAVQAAVKAGQLLLNTRLSSLLKNLSPLESSKMNGIMAYAITSLSYAALRLNCVDTSEHIVSEELKRVQGYFKKIKMTQDKLQGSASMPSSRIDQSAAHRLVSGSLGKRAVDSAAGTKRGRNEGLDDAGQDGPNFSASRRSQSAVLGVAEKSGGNKSGASALGVAPKRAHLKWKEGLKSVAAAKSGGKRSSSSKKARKV
jgi:hypothetical protein